MVDMREVGREKLATALHWHC